MTAVQEAYERALWPTGELEQIRTEAWRLTQKSDKLLPVEAHTKVAITERMQTLQKATARLEFAHETGLSMIPFDVLSWRLQQKTPQRFPFTLSLPRLVLISVTDPIPTVQFSSTQGMISHAGWPGSVLELYGDVLRSLESACDDKSYVTASFTYLGAIPEASRAKIKHALSEKWFHSGEDHQRFRYGNRQPEAEQHVYLLCEADPWQLETRKVPKPVQPPVWDRLDPLVVGIKHDALWLIDKFDPTPIEEYVAIEFTERPALTS